MARFATTGSPPISLPRASGSAVAIAKSRPTGSRAKPTISRFSLGSSIPITAAPRHGGNPRRQGRHRARDVIGQTDHPAGLEARRGLQFVHGDHRARAHADDLAFDAVVIQNGFQHPRVFFQRLVAQMMALMLTGFDQKVQRWQFDTARVFFSSNCSLQAVPRPCARVEGWTGLRGVPVAAQRACAARPRGSPVAVQARQRLHRRIPRPPSGFRNGLRAHFQAGGFFLACARAVRRRLCPHWQAIRLRCVSRISGSGPRPRPLVSGATGSDLNSRVLAAHAIADHIGDLGADPILARGIPSITLICGGLDQLRFGHPFGAPNERRHPRQQATGLFQAVRSPHLRPVNRGSCGHDDWILNPHKPADHAFRTTPRPRLRRRSRRSSPLRSCITRAALRSESQHHGPEAGS